jgi:hypothetical protein
MGQAKTVATHDEIRSCAPAHGARPARVKSTAAKRGGDVLRVDFREPDRTLETICRDEFFETLDDNDLALVEQHETRSGRTSRVANW